MTLLQDLRYGIRLLRKNPAFAAVAVISLALGIGANTAIFTLIDAVMLRLLPVKEPGQLALFGRAFPYPRYEQFRDRNEVFSGMFAVSALDQVNLGAASPSTHGEEQQRASGRLVTGNYFSLLGVRPFLGRILTEEDDKVPGGHPVAVISHAFWKRRFGLDPTVIGRTIYLGAGRLVWGVSMNEEEVATSAKAPQGGTPFTIVGVAPPEFFGETVGDAPDFWIPMMMQAQVMPGKEWLSRRDVGWVRIVARVKPGMSIAQAEAGMDVLFKQLITQELGSGITEEQRRFIQGMKLVLLPGGKGFLREEHGKNSVTSVREFSDPLLILMAMVAVVLLIACANVANLLLARSTARRKEIAIRLSLGAGRLRLMRQLLTESVLLAFLGGAVGLLFAAWGTALLVSLVSGFLSSPLAVTFRLDGRILAFTGGVSLLTGILFGLAPALRATQLELHPILKDSSGVSGGRQRHGLRKMLVVSQVVLSLLLLIAAILLVRTLQNLRAVDVGYSRENLLLIRIDPGTSGYRGPEIARLAQDLQHRFAAISGVRGATYSENGLFNGPESIGPINVDGNKQLSGGDILSHFDHAGPAYFGTVGIPVLLGRDISERDGVDSPRVAVINETMAQFYFPGVNPIGKRIFWIPGGKLSLEVVGVVRNVQDHSVRWKPVRRFYVPFSQPIEPISTLVFEIRTLSRPEILIAALEREVREADPSIPILSIQTLDQTMERSFLLERIIATLASIFGAVALLLSTLGLYGVMSYATVRRTSEIGLRMALGAQTGDVIRMVLRESMTLVAAGIIIGIPAGLAATRFITSWLFGLKASDPPAIMTAVSLVAAVTVVAGYIPARRASRVDPMVALRCE